MTATATAARGQAFAETLMTDTCTITRAGSGTFNETTGVYDTTPSTVYSGKCRVRPMAIRADHQVDAGDAAVQIWPFVVSLPLTVTTVDASDTLTITASDDPGLVGRVLVVKSVALGSQITARRLGCDIQET